ncbi:MAG: sulfite exporter TauE/SafE family protein [Candidatus Kapabacteria bacterium]|nr:sulfite exporter TauE/SafE family protein [Candidatus Kapabacteria bacterium]
MRGLRFYLPYATFVLVGLSIVYTTTDVLPSVLAAWPAAVAMVFGSFIGGASAEGGGAIAFPVFTLIFKIAPASARNFSFAIQSVGMVSASLMIIGRGIPIEKRAVFYPAIGAVFGLLIGTYGVVPHLDPTTTKLFFVSLWMSFGIGLWRANRNASRIVAKGLPPNLTQRDIFNLIGIGVLGGIVTSIFGNGICMVTFCCLTLWYGIDERIATPTSVVLMSVITVCGFFLHAVVIQDFGPIEYHTWLAAAPVVVFFSPLGAFTISYWKRLSIARLLYTIITLQLLGAFYVLGFTFEHLMFSAIVIIVGTWLMIKIDRSGNLPVQVP